MSANSAPHLSVAHATVPASSVSAMQVLTPTATSKTVGTLTLTIVASVKTITIWASSTGVTMNYNAAATAGSVAVPTTPMEMDVNSADLALLQFLGNGTLTVNIIQLG
jgi:hypothetical protein